MSEYYQGLINQLARRYMVYISSIKHGAENSIKWHTTYHQTNLDLITKHMHELVDTSIVEIAHYPPTATVSEADLRQHFKAIAKELKKYMILVTVVSNNNKIHRIVSFTSKPDLAPLYSTLLILATPVALFSGQWEPHHVDIEMTRTPRTYNFKFNFDESYQSWKNGVLTNPTTRKILGLEELNNDPA